MVKKTVRDNVYDEDRLKRDHPTIYADLKAGKYRTVTDAALVAGLKTKRTRLDEMKNAWGKASNADRNGVGRGATKLQPYFITALEKWLTINSKV